MSRPKRGTHINCAQCGAAFYVTQGLRLSAKYCGRTCMVVAKSGAVDPVGAFRHKVDVRGPAECWSWKGAITSHGYGCVSHNGRVLGAHKVSYLLFKGAVPDGMEVMHSCDNPPCVNPEHLDLGTRQDNSDDKVAKGRTKKGGVELKLTSDHVREIRRLRGIEGSGALAKRFGVGQPHIINIWNRRIWKGVQP